MMRGTISSFRALALGGAFCLTLAGSAYAQAGGDEQTNLWNQAQEALAKNDPTSAGEAAKNFEKLLPLVLANSPAAEESVRFNIGYAHLMATEYEAAAKAFIECLTKFPIGKGEYATRCALGAGRAYTEKGDFEKAIAPLSEAAKDPEYRAEAGYYLGQAFSSLKRFDDAMRVYRSLMGSEVRSPQQTMAALQVVSLLAEEKKLEDLGAYLDRLTRQSGVREAIAWFSNKLIIESDELTGTKGNFEAALELLRVIPPREQMIKIQAEGLSRLQDKIKSLDAAIARAQKSPSLGKDSNLTTQLESLKAAAKTTQEALEFIRGKEDLDASILMRRGRCLFHLDRMEEALISFRRIRTKFPKSSDAQAASYAEIVTLNKLERSDEMQGLAKDYIKAYPTAQNAEGVSMIVGNALLQSEKWAEAAAFFEDMSTRFESSTSKPSYLYYQGLATSQMQDMKSAVKIFADFIKKYPDSSYVEDCYYRLALCTFYANDYKGTLDACNEYLAKFPQGRYAGDIVYRLCFIEFSDKSGDDKDIQSRADDIITRINEHLARNPDDLAAGSMYCLLGDVWSQRKQKGEDKALEAYKAAVDHSKTDEISRYGLESATTILQAKKDWDGIAQLHGDFIKKNPGSQLALLSVSWVAKMKVRAGKGEEAASMLSEFLKNTFADPDNEQVELILEQILQTIIPKKKLADQNLDELDAKLTTVLNKAAEGTENETTVARTLYARARLAEQLRQRDKADNLILAIARTTDPSKLSPTLLMVSGEALLKQGELDKATAVFERLKDRYKESTFSDAGPVGLGRVALARKEPEEALSIFNQAITDSPGNSRYKEAMSGKLQALADLKRYDDATKLALEISENRQFRGETIAKALMILGQVLREQATTQAGDTKKESLAKAHAYYQRVYVAYKAMPEICAEAYFHAYECAKDLQDDTLAQNTINDLANNPKLANTEYGKKAQSLAK